MLLRTIALDKDTVRDGLSCTTGDVVKHEILSWAAHEHKCYRGFLEVVHVAMFHALISPRGIVVPNQ